MEVKVVLTLAIFVCHCHCLQLCPALRPGGNDDANYRLPGLAAVDRRVAISLPVTTVGAAIFAGNPTLSSAAVIGGAQQSARVTTWPGIENLEPMYELKLSIDAVVVGVADSDSWPYVQKRLEKFFQGGIFSEKNFYFGVGLQYMNDIAYDKRELPNYIVLDKQTRYELLDETMKSLERLKLSLSSPNAFIIKETMLENARSSQTALASWFALIPEQDVSAVTEFFEHVKRADTDKNGRLSENELSALSSVEEGLWRKRVAKFG